MNIIRNIIAPLFLAACAATVSNAADVGGIKVEDKATVGGRDLVLNGAGLRSRLMFKVYVGALYLPQKTANAADAVSRDQPRRMTLLLQRDVSADALLEALRAGLAENNSQAELDRIKPQVEQFYGIFKTVGEAKAGQVINIDYIPGEGTRILLDGQPKGSIAGENFNTALMKTWLGDHPVQESLKKALLGAQ
jgi:hypothetical protein